LQLNPALNTNDPAMVRAACAMSRSLQVPGATITGLTLPSSLVTCLSISGVPRARRASLSGEGWPHTIASWVASDPVTWIASMPGCAVKYCPTSAPPYANASPPAATSGARASSNSGPRYALTGLSLSSTGRPNEMHCWSTSSTGIDETLPAPRTRHTSPLGFAPASPRGESPRSSAVRSP